MTFRSPIPCSSSQAMARSMAASLKSPSSQALLMAGPSPVYASPFQSAGGWTVRTMGSSYALANSQSR